MKIRIICLALAALLLILPLASCSESKTNAEEETAPVAEPPSASDETVPVEEEEPAEILPDIPELDFGGEDFTFLTSGTSDDNGSDWITYDVSAEELNGEVINDAVFERNSFLMETYNFKFIEIKASSTVHDTLRKDVKGGGGAYDAGFTGLMRAQTLAADGFTHRMSDIPYVDMSKPWWDHRAAEDMAMFGDVYCGTGDITVIDNDATWILMFNKQMILDLQLESIYDLVREDRWYYDTLYDMLRTASRDVDGNGKMEGPTDIFGMCTTGNTCYGLLYASGEKVAPKDADGMPTLISDLNRITSVVEKAGMILGDLDHVFICDRTGYSTDNLRHIFEEGRALFYGEVMQCITRMRESETDFGVIPWPKFDEAQSKYYNFVHNTAGKCIVLPVSQGRMEMAGAIIEAMAAKSMYTLTPAYYDVCMTYKYVRDEESSGMLNLILESRCFDPAYINDWGLASTAQSVIYNGGTNFASKWNGQVKVFNKMKDKMLTKFEDLKAERGD